MSVMPVGFESASAPETGNAVRRRRYYAAHKDAANESSRKYRHDNSKWQTDAHYLSRPIVAFDGEGISLEDGSHRYVMLAGMSSVDGVYRSVTSESGLSTVECLDFVLDVVADTPGAINVIYGGGYDFNMWLRDFNRSELQAVYSRKFIEWNGYRIGWRRGKSFYVKRLEDGLSATIYDTVPFFQTSFVKACDSYLGERFVERDLIVASKALRSAFTRVDVPEITTYNSAELTNLIMLVSELRSRLNKVGLRPRRWDGPGAVAAVLLQRERVKAAMSPCPEPVSEAARYAYAGGRFEVVKFGHVEEPAFEYDVNSAYPAALRLVPNLAKGRWVRSVGTPRTRETFALYHIQWTSTKRADWLPGPLFRRGEKGAVSYPMHGTGWYWAPEYESLKAYQAATRFTVDLRYVVLDAWTFVEDDPEDRPFAFIDGLYNKRQALKAAGDGAHVGIKLALNSLYGKLAQQVGWLPAANGKPMRIPPFHQLEWAGFVTSWCRARVLEAALFDLDSVIAFETDAVFTSEPLPIVPSTELGGFEATQFDALTYFQSGMYYGTLSDGSGQVAKSRGVDLGQLTREKVIEAMSQPIANDRVCVASLTRFVGAGVALSQSFRRWQRWETLEKHITVEPTGKRMHWACERDDASGSLANGVWHHTACPFVYSGHSHAFPVEWVNPDPAMKELPEKRDTETEWE